MGWELQAKVYIRKVKLNDFVYYIGLTVNLLGSRELLKFLKWEKLDSIFVRDRSFYKS
jgi:hypothetical protein